jgi:hypothetical protein
MLRFIVILFAIIAIIYTSSGCKTTSGKYHKVPMGFSHTVIVKR